MDNTLFGEVQKAKPNAEKKTHLRLKAEKDYFEALNMVKFLELLEPSPFAEIFFHTIKY